MFLLFSFICVIALCAQNSLIKGYGDKHPDTEITYSFLSAVFALLICVCIGVAGTGLYFNPGSLVYSVLFALFYAGSTVTFVLAVGCGSLALTATIHSFALIIPIIVGFAVWNEPISTIKIVGIVFLCASLLCIAEKGNADSKISPRWVLLMCVSFLCEGLAPVSLTAHKKAVGEELAAKSESMVLVVAYIIAVVGLFVTVLAFEGKKKKTGVATVPVSKVIKFALPFAGVAGACNGIYNYVYSVASGKFDVSKFVPVVTAGQIIFTALVSVLLFKEKLSKKQYVSICCGIVAIVLLNV